MVAIGLSPSAGSSFAPKKDGDVRSLSRLTGSWKGPMWGGTFQSHYTSADTGTVMSYSELRKEDGHVALFEFERFLEVGAVVMMHALPRGPESLVARTSFGETIPPTSVSPVSSGTRRARREG